LTGSGEKAFVAELTFQNLLILQNQKVEGLLERAKELF
jgi:hypothetical protein